MDITSIRRHAVALTATAFASFALCGAALYASSASAAPAQQRVAQLQSAAQQLDSASSSGGPTAAQNQKIQE